MLVDGKRLAGDGRLIDLQESIFCYNAAVGGNDGTLFAVSGAMANLFDFTHFFDLENITRHNFWCFNFLKLAVAENSCLESERLLQFFDNGTGLEFLNETDTGVEQKQSANNTEVDPVLKTGSKNGGSLR
jgi:hypothetical protein